jgi:serine/threonine-protein kinase RsbW
MDHLREILLLLRDEIHKAGFKGAQGTQLELALEEAIVNIIKYAYPHSHGKIKVRCTPLKEKGIKVVLIDEGIPFNPTLNVSNKEIQEIKKSETPGGYGIFLIFAIMDTVEYEFKKGCNILTLTKRI